MNINIPKKENKTKIISLRMTEAEYQLFESVAKELQCTIAILLIEATKLQIQLSKESK